MRLAVVYESSGLGLGQKWGKWGHLGFFFFQKLFQVIYLIELVIQMGPIKFAKSNDMRN